MTKAISHVAMVLPDLRPGGAERNALILAEVWAAMGIKVDLVVMQRQGALLADVPEGVSVVSLDVPRTRHVIKACASYLRDHQPDVALVNMWPLTVMCILAARQARCATMVATIDHNTLSKSYQHKGWLHRQLLRFSMRFIYPFAGVRIVVSRGVAEDLSQLSSIAVKDFTVIYNPVRSVESSATHADVSSHWKSGSGKRIITVGSLKAQKNHALLMRAFAAMDAYPDAQLMILGDGELRSELERLACELGVEDRVAMPGFFSDPMPFYQSADLFVLSSDYEGFGNVIVEALACGVPVVSTNCPSGPAEILEDGRYGSLVPVGDAQALASAMADALQTVHDPAMLRERARAFSAEKIAARYLEILCQAHEGST